MPGRQRPSVLLVEDEPAILKSYKRVLEDAGFAVEAIADGVAAAAALAARRFDLLISDVTLPGLTGLELLRLARDRHPSLPVVLMTGGDLDETEAKAEHGAFRCLQKPMRWMELRQSAEAAVRGQR
jgi:two-component system response regulator GlrR